MSYIIDGILKESVSLSSIFAGKRPAKFTLKVPNADLTESVFKRLRH